MATAGSGGGRNWTHRTFYYRAAADTPETGFYVGGLLPYQGYDRRNDTPRGGITNTPAILAAGRVVGTETADGGGTLLDAGARFARPRYVSSGLEPEPDDQVTDEHGQLVPADRVRIVRAAIALIRIAGWLGGGGTPIMTARGATVLVGGWRAVRGTGTTPGVRRIRRGRTATAPPVTAGRTTIGHSAGLGYDHFHRRGRVCPRRVTGAEPGRPAPCGVETGGG